MGGFAVGPKAVARARRRDPNTEIIIVDKGDLFSYAGCGMPFYMQAYGALRYYERDLYRISIKIRKLNKSNKFKLIKMQIKKKLARAR